MQQRKQQVESHDGWKRGSDHDDPKEGRTCCLAGGTGWAGWKGWKRSEAFQDESRAVTTHAKRSAISDQ
jgi:hypothetical protein